MIIRALQNDQMEKINEWTTPVDEWKELSGKFADPSTTICMKLYEKFRTSQILARDQSRRHVQYMERISAQMGSVAVKMENPLLSSTATKFIYEMRKLFKWSGEANWSNINWIFSSTNPWWERTSEVVWIKREKGTPMTGVSAVVNSEIRGKEKSASTVEVGATRKLIVANENTSWIFSIMKKWSGSKESPWIKCGEGSPGDAMDRTCGSAI